MVTEQANCAAATLTEILRAEISRTGSIPFARFMELALYHPEFGYYERAARPIGRRGDFYTSASVGPVFGELLAFQFADWLTACGTIPGAKLQIVEAGAHDGQLAADILTWLRGQRPEVFERLEYWIVEPSGRRQQWQRQRLAPFAGRVRWFATLPEGATARAEPVRGVIFSNELLDAFPCRRVGWDAPAQSWFEWGVSMAGDQFIWERLPVFGSHAARVAGNVSSQFGGLYAESLEQLAALPPELLSVLPDGFSTELCPAATAWWRRAAAWLEQGKLLTLDYGLDAEQFFAPQRQNGTLRAYRRHRMGDDLLAQPGGQDITAHVNFSAIERAGESAGLKTDAYTSQAEFLVRLAAGYARAPSAEEAWAGDRGRQLQTLTHPEHLGRRFQVFVQARE